MGHFVTPLIYGALANAAPNQVQADSGMMNLLTFQGTRTDGRPFTTLYFASGGYGALRDLDGWATLPHPSNMAVVPVEVWETLTHTTVLSKRLRTDSGGPGQWRGGLGIHDHRAIFSRRRSEAAHDQQPRTVRVVGRV